MLFLLPRCIFFAFLAYALHSAAELPSGPSSLILSSIAGCILGNHLADTKISFKVIATRALLLYLVLYIAFKISFSVFSLDYPVFSLYTQSHTLWLAVFSATFSSIATYSAARYRSWLSLEFVGILFLSVFILSPHRNLSLDSPLFVGDFAWFLGVSNIQSFLILSGIALIIAVILISGSIKKQSVAITTNTNGQTKKRYLAYGSTLILILITGVFTNSIFKSLVNNKLQNGVGTADGKGVTPLSFHSNLGSSNEPAALLRLDGDYAKNTQKNMLYLREAVLTAFNGRELVAGDEPYNTDTPSIMPGTSYVKDQNLYNKDRQEINYSVYLLADHKKLFAADYPTKVVPLKNPNPTRFKGAYRATSLSPIFNLEDITFDPFGDPSWTDAERKEYVQPHTDIRYKELAEKIAKDAPSPMGQVQAIINYLSKNSIYTLRPGHDVGKDEDPVAPFLFGDMRGYCVHFAHATVYMLRALGIPSRIATGYLTDMSQAKDGHMLLRMSDRHAWAEVFITNRGWIPFDTKPEQVESAADPNVDQNLLDELMNLVGPDEETLPKVETPTKNSPLDTIKDYSLNISFTPILLSFLAFYMFLKVYLYYGWKLFSGNKKLLHVHKSLLARLADMGILRSFGETRSEFKSKVSNVLGFDMLTTSEDIVALYFDKSNGTPVKDEKIWDVYKKFNMCFPLWKRTLFWFSPNSILKILFNISLIIVIAIHSNVYSQPETPSETEQTDKTATELIKEATDLFLDEQPLEGRTKLLQAIQKDRNSYKAYMLLANYYLVNVGHYRLSLQYQTEAKKIFEKIKGMPPYTDDEDRETHARLLYILSQIYLNLDDYEGSLKILDEFTSYDYFSGWFPSTKAWVLMKLGRLDESIKTARAGIMFGEDLPRTLNILGILLSMNNEADSAIKVLKQAIEIELAFGKDGQPATPLNNIGEIYREQFMEAKAESSWLRGMSLPDGCEHVLSSVNVSQLYLEQLKPALVQKTMDDFEACDAQFPLRNGEEHKALVALERGKAFLMQGKTDEAIKQLEIAKKERQWFGKIGTDPDDLKSALLSTLSQAYNIKANDIKRELIVEDAGFLGINFIKDYLLKLYNSSLYSFQSYWTGIKALDLLTRNLNDFEDLKVRHTDSLLDYGQLGKVTEGLPIKILEIKLKKITDDDLRPGSKIYYNTYLAFSLINTGRYEEAKEILSNVVKISRMEDAALKLEAIYGLYQIEDNKLLKQKLAIDMFTMNPASPKVYDVALPVNIINESAGQNIDSNLQKAGFIKSDFNSPYTIRLKDTKSGYDLSFSVSNYSAGQVQTKGDNVNELINKLRAEVFHS